MGSCDMAAGPAEEAVSFDRLFGAWPPIGTATVEAARPRPGAHVLDAWCGSGASTIPAAEQAGPHGAIGAVDPAEPSRERGRTEAAVRGLGDVRFVHGDVFDRPAPPGGHDAVTCAPGISSFLDAEAGTERLLGAAAPLRRAVRADREEASGAPASA